MSFDSARERDAFEQSINEDVGVFVESPEMNEDINYKNNENDEESPREEPHIDVVDEADQVCFQIERVIHRLMSSLASEICQDEAFPI